MNLVILQRNIFNNKETLGELTFNGFFCKTLELPDLLFKSGISCVPTGLYDVIWSFSPRLLKYTYEVTNVPSRSGIRIHKGNFFFDVEGCILLGSGYADINKDGQLDVINSAATLKQFEDMMNRQPFQLKIIGRAL